MMKHLFLSLLSIAALYNRADAQDEFDALRYSFTPYQGTARGMGIGGAVGSIGADFSCLSVNPAGIGIYKTGELALSPSFSISKNKGTYLGNQLSESDSKFNLTNFGLVVSTDLKAKGYTRTGWKFINFGVGMNRMATFKNEFTYAGKNNENSIVETFADDFNSLGGINSYSLSHVNFSAYGAYNTALVDYGQGPDSLKAVSYVPYQAGLNQSKRVTETGGMSEYLFSLGGNYLDKLMLGATLGIVSLSYDRTMRFDEEDASGDLTNYFKYMQYTERLATTGTGINFKLGAIYKPSTNFRLGIALHTPTHIELNDASSISVTSHTDSLFLQNNPSASPISSYNQDSALVFNYSLNTPYKALVSAMFLFGKMGFITADVEYVDYSSMKYRYGAGFENSTDAINNIIQNTYQDAVNIRVGAEAKLQNVSLRGGFAYYGSPAATNIGSGARSNISVGLGYRERYWFVDASFIHSTQKTLETPYILARENANVQTSTIQNRKENVVLTLGVKF